MIVYVTRVPLILGHRVIKEGLVYVKNSFEFWCPSAVIYITPLLIGPTREGTDKANCN